ncbi:MAG: quinone-dependent dihydroorotate dehydrogenase [Vibrionaceae bacterium]
MLYRLAKKVFFQFDPEQVHDLLIKKLHKSANTPLEYLYSQTIAPRPTQVMGLNFANCVGLAAGLDKNGECIDAFAAMGFGFLEVGTVTARAQNGNDKPRLFRIPAAGAIINRMGFNNHGVDVLVENVKKAKYKGILGINIGKNKDTPLEKGKDDYLACMEKVYAHASYIAVNISSPNTPDLRSLQYGEALDDLLASLKAKQQTLSQQQQKYVPLAVKIAPDLSHSELVQLADALVRHKIDAAIATNTTLDRALVQNMPHSEEAGGLSGRPLQHKSTQIIKLLHNELGEQLPIIGAGGIDSAIAAREKMQAGAKLVQIYSGFIYQGPTLIKEIALST